MQVSYNLLKEYVDIELSPNELADRLSMNGIVAEHSKAIFDDVKGVVVGEIKKIKKHKQTENLSVCLVDIKKEEFEVVCGAKNIKVGDRIPFALEGAILPELGKIEAKDIQGVFSRGMICSASELGLEKSKSPGVLILEKSFPLGKEINNLKGIQNDFIFDFEIFSNRPDLMSIIGIAREIAAFSGKELHVPELDIVEVEEKITESISVQVKDQELCPRYAGRIIRGLQIEESPFWLRWKLFLLGIRPINNVVDVTNYVMMETGQPLHAFDLNYIQGSQIIIRRAYPAEKFSTLDGVQRQLTEENLVIADQERAIALAGVMGGENSEIKVQTKDIFLESAYFDPINNRRTSRYFSLRTDASNRFEKGIDPEGQIYALDRTAYLINQLTSGKILQGVIDEHSKKVGRKKPIELYFDKVEKIAGTTIGNSTSGPSVEMIGILTRLGFKVIKKNADSAQIIPPSFRGDIQRDVDIIEEIIKIFGYEKIPATLFKSTVIQKGKSKAQKIRDKIGNILVGCGLHQMISYSMITPVYFDWMNLPDSHFLRQAIQLSNPLIQDQTIMRTTLIPGVLKAVQWNANRKVEKIKLFEIGKIFLPQNNERNNQLPLEKLMITGALTKSEKGNIWEKSEKWDIFYLKGILESLFDGLRIRDVDYVQGSFPAFDLEKNGIIKMNNHKIGIFGEVSHNTINFLGIPGDVYLFELDFSVIYSLIDQRIVFKPLPKYPSIHRDIAMVVAEHITVDQMKKAILESNYRFIKKVELFDIFRGKQVEKGCKSVAFSIIFQAEDRTLTDDEVDKMLENVKIKLKNYFNATLRQ
ncbi:MAG: phenylalanine--tRNA ligase subunit beta [Elusimicrobiota bacterium]